VVMVDMAAAATDQEEEVMVVMAVVTVLEAEAVDGTKEVVTEEAEVHGLQITLVDMVEVMEEVAADKDKE